MAQRTGGLGQGGRRDGEDDWEKAGAALLVEEPHEYVAYVLRVA